MSEVRDRALLLEMIEAAGRVLRWTDGLSRADFLANEQLLSAVAMQIIVIGEGARLLSPALREHEPDVPWGDMINMRNRLAHGYARASAIIVQDTAANWVPLLLPPLRRLQEHMGPEET